jgi:ATP phosphoribosyltransferase
MKSEKKSMNSFKSRPIRLGVPSKGRMEVETQDFLKNCGFSLTRNNRQYIGYIQGPTSIQLVFEHQEDIIRSVSNGTIELGIVGYDLFREIIPLDDEKVLLIHDSLNFGTCNLVIAVPETWSEKCIEEIKKRKNCVLKVATKFPKLTTEFLTAQNICFEIIEGRGSLEVYPELGRSDLIVDLVSTGQTLKDNRLKMVEGGTILNSQAVLIGSKKALMDPSVLKITCELIEYFEATLRAQKFVSVFVNIRGENEEEISKAIFAKKSLSGLQGPTISSVYTKTGEKMFAIHVIVEKEKLQLAIRNLREIGGSGVVVAQTLYIFEEEPLRYKKLKENLVIVNEDL